MTTSEQGSLKMTHRLLFVVLVPNVLAAGNEGPQPQFVGVTCGPHATNPVFAAAP